MRIKYFEAGFGYIALTYQCPPDFKSVLFVGKYGTGPTNADEQVFMPEQIRGLREIAKVDMPPAWMLAVGYEKPVAPPKPAPRPPAEELVEEPLFDPDNFDLIAHIPVKRRREPRPVQQGKPDRAAFDIGLIIGLAIAAAGIYFGFL